MAVVGQLFSWPVIFVYLPAVIKHHISNLNGIKVVRKSDHFHSYDINIMCMLASSNMNLSDPLRNYLTELASLCSGNDPEFAAAMTGKGETLLKDPVGTITEIINSSLRSKNCSFSLPTDLDILIWRAQHKTFFSLIDQYRLGFIERFRSIIPYDKTIYNQIGEEIEDNEYIELTVLKHLCDCGDMCIPNNDYDELKFFRQCRNDLSHLKILSFSDVEKLIRSVV